MEIFFHVKQILSCYYVETNVTKWRKCYHVIKWDQMEPCHFVIILLCEAYVIFRNQIFHKGPNVVIKLNYHIFFCPENFSNSYNYRERWWYFILYWQEDDALYLLKVNIYDPIYSIHNYCKLSWNVKENNLAIIIILWKGHP